MQRWWQRTQIAAVCVLVLVGGGACATADKPVVGGPLDVGGGNFGECFVLHAGWRQATAGFDAATNRGEEVIAVSRVELLKPKGLVLESSSLIPLSREQHILMGGLGQYPPTAEELAHSGVRWQDRQPVPGAEIDPGVTANLVLAVRVTGRTEGAAQGVRLTYHVGDKKYIVDNTTTFHVVSAPPC